MTQSHEWRDNHNNWMNVPREIYFIILHELNASHYVACGDPNLWQRYAMRVRYFAMPLILLSGVMRWHIVCHLNQTA